MTEPLGMTREERDQFIEMKAVVKEMAKDSQELRDTINTLAAEIRKLTSSLDQAKGGWKLMLGIVGFLGAVVGFLGSLLSGLLTAHHGG